MRFLLWDAALGAARSQLTAIHEYCEDKQQRAAPKPCTSLKTDAMGCCARRFPQQYTSIARTSNNAQRPFHRFNRIKKCPVGVLCIPPGTKLTPEPSTLPMRARISLQTTKLVAGHSQDLSSRQRFLGAIQVQTQTDIRFVFQNHRLLLHRDLNQSTTEADTERIALPLLR